MREHGIIRIFVKIFVILFIILFCLFLYSFYLNPYMLNVKEIPVVDSQLPDNYNGLKIAHFSDIHYGRTVKESQLKNIVKELNELNADIVLFTGDLFDYENISSSDEKLIIKYFKDINSKLFKFAVVGDYDEKYLDAYKNILLESNFQLLDNSSKLVYYNGSVPINIVGISKIDNIQNLYVDDLYNITLLHQPDLSEQIYNSNLLFAGHSLGGQIYIPFLGGIRKINGARKYVNGVYTVNDSKLFISNGLGTQDNNFRFLNSPSITLYRIYNY